MSGAFLALDNALLAVDRRVWRMLRRYGAMGKTYGWEPRMIPLWLIHMVDNDGLLTKCWILSILLSTVMVFQWFFFQLVMGYRRNWQEWVTMGMYYTIHWK